MAIFHTPVRIHSGDSCLAQLGTEAAALGQRALVVCGASAKSSGALGRALRLLREAGLVAEAFGRLSGEPGLATVAGAIEARLLGIPSFAISLSARENYLFADAAEVAANVAAMIFGQGLSEGTLLNVNVPNVPLSEIKGTAITRLGKRIYHQMTVERVDPRGKKYYWIGGGEPDWEREEGTDFDAVERNLVSITPLHLDLTDYAVFDRLRPLEQMSYKPSAPFRSDE